MRQPVIDNSGLSIRSTLAGAFILMGLLTIGLALMTGSVYRDLTFENQRESLGALLELKANELLAELVEESRAVGMRVQHEQPFRTALRTGDAAALRGVLDEHFAQRAVTWGRLKLVKLRVLDSQLRIVAQSSKGELAIDDSTVICPALLERARLRQGADRLQMISDICLYEGRPVTAVITAVGLRAQGYVQVIADTAFTLRKIESSLRMPLRLLYADGSLAYESVYWPTPKDMQFVLQAVDWITTPFGEAALTIQVAKTVEDLFHELAQTRSVVIGATFILTAIVIVLVLLVLQRMTFEPLKQLSRQVRRLSESKQHLGEKVHVRGNAEVRALATDFNAMTDELQGLYSKLEDMAFTDSLTELPNRVLFQDRTEQIVSASQREHCHFALMIMDLDRFKEVNDALGHEYGDKLLQVVGERLHSCIRGSDKITRFSGDTVARLGGDEFAMVLPTIQTPEGAARVAQRISDEISRPIQVGQHTFHIGISIGVALYPQDGEGPAALIRNADLAMYQAKKSQRQYAFYDKCQDEDSLQKLMLGSELRQAIHDEKLQLYYQPKIDLASGRVCGVEVLTRWIDPKLGFIPPDTFIELAERIGMIQPLTLWVLRTALEQCARWHQQQIELEVAVNLSVLSLQDVALPDQVRAAVLEAGLQPRYLSLEITEGAMMSDPEHALQILEQLDAMGVHLSVDDFGTGYSSLGYLKRLPVDEIKIDRSFVMEMQRDSQDLAIVRSTIELSHNMGMKVIAEGVEDQATYERLIELGCDLAQGYYMGKPMSAQDFERWLRESEWGLVQRKEKAV
jgi:diguanylate cyclase (GGDEF)-like protein